MTATEQIKFLVPKFLKEQDLKKIAWPREMAIWKKLLKKAPFSYWEKIELKFKLNSAAWFLSADGVMYLKSLKTLSFPEPKVEKIPDNSESFEVEGVINKPKTLKQFVGSI